MQHNPVLVNASCKFDYPNGDFPPNIPISGTVTFTPNYNLSFNSIWWSVSMKVESTNNSSYKEAHKTKEGQLPLNQTTWMRNIPYDYPFSFDPISTFSYQGKYIKIQWEVDFVIELAINSLAIVKQIAIQKKDLRQQLLPSKHISFNFPFQVFNTTQHYQFKRINSNINLTNQLLKYYLTAGASLVGIIVGIVNYSSYLFWEILGSSTLGIGFYKTFVGPKKLGNIMWTIEPFTADQFFLEIEIGRNWSSIDRVKVLFLISELSLNEPPHVIYRHDATLSPIKKSTITTRIPFPPLSQKIPPTFSNNVISIQWRIQATIFLKSGKEHELKQIIEVDF